MKSDYAWIVTQDHLDDKKVEVIGPSNASPEQIEELKAGAGETFKMYDDDGELYYTGRIIGDYCGFEPLDDYGEPNAGATEIKYKNDKDEWETL
jgi:hypothetical protein